MKPGVVTPGTWNVVLAVLGGAAVLASQAGLVPDAGLTNILSLFGAWAIGKAQKRTGDVNAEKLPTVVSTVLDMLVAKATVHPSPAEPTQAAPERR